MNDRTLEAFPDTESGVAGRPWQNIRHAKNLATFRSIRLCLQYQRFCRNDVYRFGPSIKKLLWWFGAWPNSAQQRVTET